MRVDDDGLLQALHEGLFEQPLWDEFLDRLRARTGADCAVLSFRPLGEDAVVTLHSRQAPASLAGSAADRMIAHDPLPAMALRENRVYALDEIFADATGNAVPQGISAMRAVHVTEPGGVGAWLSCWGGKAVGPAAGALLNGLAPHLRIALRAFVSLEREKFRSSITDQAFDRLKMGWLTLDGQCRIVESTPNVEQMFQRGAPLRRGRYDRLVPASPLVDRQLAALVKGYSETGEGRSQAFNLSQDPWTDMLVAPLHRDATQGSGRSVAIVYLSGDRRSHADRCDQLVDLFGLLPSEARLASLLGQGTGMAEAAQALGITIETARNYSKKIYAKTGARGHAELVRIVMTSIVAVG